MSHEYMGVTDIANVTEALIASLVQNQLVERSRLLSTVLDYTGLVEPGSKSVGIPRGSDLSAAAKSEGTPGNVSHFTYAADALLLSSHQYVAVDIEDIAKLQSKVPLLQDLTDRMGNALGDALDTLINTQLLLCSASTPDHIIQYNDATNEDIEVVDLVNAKKLLEIQKVDKADRFMVICPTQEANMLKIDTFVEADKYGGREALLNGEIGRVYGFKVIVSNVNETDKDSLFYHKSHCAVAKQQEIKFESQRNILNISDIVMASYLAGAKVLDAGKRGVLIEVTP